MTTTVEVHAHCDPKNQQVRIQTHDEENPQPDVFIEDGKTHEVVVYEDRTVTVSEVEK